MPVVRIQISLSGRGLCRGVKIRVRRNENMPRRVPLHTNRRVGVIPAGSAGIQRPGTAVRVHGGMAQTPPFTWQTLMGRLLRNDKMCVRQWPRRSEAKPR